MKKDDEFGFKNEEYDDDARAVKESELLPIFEAMDFSGDIQPLEDISVPEPVMADFDQRKKNEPKSSEKVRDFKKKKIPVFTGLNKSIHIVLVAALLIIIIGGGAFGIYSAVNNGTNEAPIQSIYSSDKTSFLNCGTDKVYEISNAENVVVSKDGKKVFYSVNASSKTGKYDIKYVDASKKSSLKKGGRTICTGVDEDWSVNADGTYVCYSVTKYDNRQYYLFGTEENESEEIASEVEEAFLPKTGDTVYFTRRNGSIYSLHRKRFSTNSESVASKISFVKFCNSDDGFEILYTVETGNEEDIDIYSVKNYDEPVQICDGVSEAYINDYVYGGNLYYFKKNASTVNWQDFITDSYYESDMKLEKPVESDYMTEYGFIIKRYILDKSAYSTAKEKYNAKLLRDEIRAELDQMDFGLAAGDGYNCHVYNSVTNKLLLTGVSLKNVLAFAEKDSPRIIVRKSVINVEDKLTMDELVKVAKSSSAASAVDYARGKVEDSFELSDECIYAIYDGSKVLNYGVQGYNLKNAAFKLDSKKMLYVLAGTKLYYNEVSTKGIGENTLVASGVSDCTVQNGIAYYMRPDDSEVMCLYSYSTDSGEKKLCSDVCSYVVRDNGNVIAFSKQGDDTENVTVGIYDGKTYKKIDSDISLNHFAYTDSSISYIKNIGNSEIANAGDMYIYFDGAEPEKVASDVTDIKYISSKITDDEIKENKEA